MSPFSYRRARPNATTKADGVFAQVRALARTMALVLATLLAAVWFCAFAGGFGAESVAADYDPVSISLHQHNDSDLAPKVLKVLGPSLADDSVERNCMITRVPVDIVLRANHRREGVPLCIPIRL